mgnify:CR=1 FL=1
MASETIRWNPNQLVMGAVIHAEQPISNLKFHRNGQYLVSTTDNSVILTDSLSGKEKKRINCKTHGVGRAAYTHHDSCIIVSGDRKQHDIRYLCLYDNRYIRSYEGHTTRVSSLSMCPTDDHFLSASDGGEDSCVLLWDLNVSNPVAKLKLPNSAEHVRVAYDDSGLIFGVMSVTGSSHSIKLYDARNYGKGPFQDIAPQSTVPRHSATGGYAMPTSFVDLALRRAYTALNSRATEAVGEGVFSLPSVSQPSSALLDQVHRHNASGVVWEDLQFNIDGSQMLVNCCALGVESSAGAVLVLDGFKSDVEPAAILRRKASSGGAAAAATGEVVAHRTSSKDKDRDKALMLGACFSSDSRHVLVGNEENEINTYEVSAGGSDSMNSMNSFGSGSSTNSIDNANTISCKHVSTLLGHTSPVGCIAANPKYDVVASACRSTSLWVHNSNSTSQ